MGIESFSVLILTLNEERGLADCLDSVSGCDDVVILDSHSTDRTVEIGRRKGARIVRRRFDNYASQRNYGLKQIPYVHDWVLMLDADERLTPELRAEIGSRLAGADSQVTMFRLRRKDYFMGRWIKHSSGYPTWFGRLVRPEKVNVTRGVNEEYHTDGVVEHLAGHIVHYPFHRGISHWLDKHNRYSDMEAALVVSQKARSASFFRIVQGLFAADPVSRRKWQKQLFTLLPGRPLWVFLGLYLWRGGFLDGRAGLRFCLLRLFYELMIDFKRDELLQQQVQEPGAEEKTT